MNPESPSSADETVLLCFDQQANLIGAAIGGLLSGAGPVFAYAEVGGNDGPWRVLFDCIGFSIQLKASAEIATPARKIFTGYDAAQSKSVLTVAFDRIAVGGERVAPVAACLLKLCAFLASELDAKAVFWRPSSILSDRGYFCGAVSDYSNGGAFPALATVDFIFNAGKSSLRTIGLSWFSGQELDLRASQFSQGELVRRAVRIVHDIAVNGAVAEKLELADIESSNILRLEPVDGGTLLVGEISSNLNAVSL